MATYSLNELKSIATQARADFLAGRLQSLKHHTENHKVESITPKITKSKTLHQKSQNQKHHIDDHRIENITPKITKSKA